MVSFLNKNLMLQEILVVIQYYYGGKKNEKYNRKKNFQRGLLSQYLQEEREYCPDLLMETDLLTETGMV